MGVTICSKAHRRQQTVCQKTIAMRIQRTTRLVCVQRATHRHAQPPPRGAEPSLRRCIHAVLRTSVPSLLPDCNSLRKQVAILTNCTVRSAAKHKNPHNSGPFKSALTAHPASSAAVRSKSQSQIATRHQTVTTRTRRKAPSTRLRCTCASSLLTLWRHLAPRVQLA
jgi:hypothetical protein